MVVAEEGSDSGEGMASMRWKLQRVSSVAELDALKNLRASPDFWLLEHDPLWGAALLGFPGTAVIVAARGGRSVAGIFVHPVGLGLKLGEFPLASIPICRHVFTGGLESDVASAPELAKLLIDLKDQLEPQGMIYLQGVRADEPLRAAVDRPEVRRAFIVLPYGNAYRRCRIRLEGNFETYLSSLSRTTRKDLKKTLRRFRQQVGEAGQLEVVTNLSKLEIVLPELRRLSAKTYQSRLLGLGIEAGNFVERQLRFGMRRGIGRVDILRVRGTPICFQIGYIYNNIFYATQTGYDPVWADVQPGILQILLTIEELRMNVRHVRYFDFMYGESLYKTRLSNSFHEESQFYLIPRTVRGWSSWALLQAVNRTSNTMGKALEELRLKQTMKKLLRRFA